MGVLDNSHHVVCSAPLRQVRLETISQPLDCGFPLERRETGTEHQMNGVDQLVREGPDGKERLDGKLLEHPVALALPSTHQHNHLVAQFEAIRLKLDTSRTNIEQKAKVYRVQGSRMRD